GPSSDERVPTFPLLTFHFSLLTSIFFPSTAFASRVRRATSSSRRWTSSFRSRLPLAEAAAYSQNSGNPIVESQYATTVSGSTPGFTFPQLTASDGVAPDNPPQTTWSVVIWMKKSLPPLGMP